MLPRTGAVTGTHRQRGSVPRRTGPKAGDQITARPSPGSLPRFGDVPSTRALVMTATSRRACLREPPDHARRRQCPHSRGARSLAAVAFYDTMPASAACEPSQRLARAHSTRRRRDAHSRGLIEPFASPLRPRPPSHAAGSALAVLRSEVPSSRPVVRRRPDIQRCRKAPSTATSVSSCLAHASSARSRDEIANCLLRLWGRGSSRVVSESSEQVRSALRISASSDSDTRAFGSPRKIWPGSSLQVRESSHSSAICPFAVAQGLGPGLVPT